MNMGKTTCASLAALIFTGALAGTASANLIITEVMSQSGSGGTEDWFELTNTGSTAITFTGYTYNDNGGETTSDVPLVGVTSIAAGESVVFVEEDDAAADEIAAFRTFWGGINSIQIGYFTGSGLSLSSNGDEVRIYNTSETLVVTADFGAATTGTSFGYDPFTATFGGLSVIDVNGAFQSARFTMPDEGDGIRNIGSPGVVPEPGSMGLIGMAGLLALRRRRQV